MKLISLPATSPSIRSVEVKREAFRALFELGDFKATAAAFGISASTLGAWWRDPRLAEVREEVCREAWTNHVADTTLLAAQLQNRLSELLEEGQLRPREVIMALQVVSDKIEFWRDLAGNQAPLTKLRSFDPEQLAKDHERLAALHRELAKRRAEIEPIEVEVELRPERDSEES